MSEFELRIVTDIADFESLAGKWDRCLASMSSPSLFLGARWLGAWWHSLGRGCELHVVIVTRGDDIVAAAPLCAREAKYYRVPVRELAFVGEPASDRQGFLLAPDTPGALDFLLQALREQLSDYDLIRLEEVPESSPARDAAPWFASEFSSGLPFVQNPGDWETFEKRLPRKFKSKMRTRRKVFDSWGEWQFDMLRGAEIVTELDSVRAVEIESQKGDSGIALFTDERNLDLIRRVAAGSDADSYALLARLTVEGELAGYLLGFVHGGVFHAYNSAFRPRYHKGSLGAWILHESVRHLIESGIREVDFLRGATFLKSKWRPEIRRNVRLVGFARGPKMTLLRFAVFRVRPWLKRMRARLRGS